MQFLSLSLLRLQLHYSVLQFLSNSSREMNSLVTRTAFRNWMLISRNVTLLSKRNIASSNIQPKLQKDELKVTFIRPNGERIEAKAKPGDSLLDVVVNNSLDFDGYGACEGTLTCSTCHVILKQEDYNRLPTGPGDEEMDMLDLAYELNETSRLGCQIIMTKDLDGLEVKLPTSINDVRN